MKYALKVASIYVFLYAVVFFGSFQSSALAQRWRVGYSSCGSCGYNARVYQNAPRYYSATSSPTYCGSYWSGDCYQRQTADVGACAPCNACGVVESTPIEVENPCRACAPCECQDCNCDEEKVEAVELENVDACEPVRACDPVESCLTCVQKTRQARPLADTVSNVTYRAFNVAGNAVKTVGSYLDAINLERTRRGLRALTLDSSLEAGAKNHSALMARSGFLFHNAPACFENCAMNRSYEGAVHAWINSPGHAANMFNPSVTRAGIGVAVDSNGNQFWTLRLR